MSCTVDLGSIPGLARCESNPGGAKKLYIIEASSVTTIPAADALTHTISTDLTIASTKQWFEIGASLGTITFTENLVGEAQNKSWEPTLQFEIPKDRPAVASQINSWIGGRFLFAYKDSSDQIKLLGNLDNPYELTQADLNIGSASTDKNMTLVQAKPLLNNKQKEFFYTGTIPLTPAP